MRKKITIIEDNKPIANMYKFKLEQEGFEVDVAHTGPEGLELVHRKRPNLVLLDLKLPHMNGDELLRRIRESEWGALLKVFIISNVNIQHAPKALETLHFEDFIVKAEHTPQQLFEKICAAIEESFDTSFDSTIESNLQLS